MALGCQKCGGTDLVQKKRTTGAGWGLFFLAVIGAFFTAGIALLLIVPAAFLTEKKARCRGCDWEWTP